MDSTKESRNKSPHRHWEEAKPTRQSPGVAVHVTRAMRLLRCARKDRKCRVRNGGSHCEEAKPTRHSRGVAVYVTRAMRLLRCARNDRQCCARNDRKCCVRDRKYRVRDKKCRARNGGSHCEEAKPTRQSRGTGDHFCYATRLLRPLRGLPSGHHFVLRNDSVNRWRPQSRASRPSSGIDGPRCPTGAAFGNLR